MIRNISRVRTLEIYSASKNIKEVEPRKGMKTNEEVLELSTESLKLLEGDNILEERIERIEAIKKSLEDGSYKMDSKKIAKQIIKYIRG